MKNDEIRGQKSNKNGNKSPEEVYLDSLKKALDTSECIKKHGFDDPILELKTSCVGNAEELIRSFDKDSIPSILGVIEGLSKAILQLEIMIEGGTKGTDSYIFAESTKRYYEEVLFMLKMCVSSLRGASAASKKYISEMLEEGS